MKYDVFTEIETKLEEYDLDRNYFDEIKKLKFLFNYVHFHHGSVGLHINGDEISAVNYIKGDDGFVVIKKDSITFAQETGIYKCYFDND
ncbi:MAG: hypothetical protein IJH20_05730 [Bacilli bacterium]|nr:hypothetical protein [Bacilli bacterium]